jgi:hypothetical protein
VTMVVATEDELSECVALRLIGLQMSNTDGVQMIRKGGNGYLRSRMANFISVAKRGPVLMLADLDRIDCPPTLIRKWRRGRALPDNLLLRVAVREIESWLLADREGFASYLNIAPQKITTSPEEISDPKHYLLNLARNAPRELRSELLPDKGSIASQGFGYNSCLREFVAKMWSPTRAAERSQSLRRAINRVSELTAPNKHTRPAQGATP